MWTWNSLKFTKNITRGTHLNLFLNTGSPLSFSVLIVYIRFCTQPSSGVNNISRTTSKSPTLYTTYIIKSQCFTIYFNYFYMSLRLGSVSGVFKRFLYKAVEQHICNQSKWTLKMRYIVQTRARVLNHSSPKNSKSVIIYSAMCRDAHKSMFGSSC